MTAIDTLPEISEDLDEGVSRSAELAPDANVPGISRKTMEFFTSLVLIIIAAFVLWDSYQVGAGWSDGMGPETGYFPSKVGWIFLGLSGFVLFQAIQRDEGEVFVTLPQLKMVAKVLAPLVIYIALIKPLGIYLSSMLFIAGFMLIVGGSRPLTILITAVTLPLLAFWVFEMQFMVPLPKGPIEAALGY